MEKYAEDDVLTGLWLGELIHFYDEIQAQGLEADFVSLKGGYVPLDPASLKFMTAVNYKWYGNRDFVERALSRTLKPSGINPDDYIAIYYTGGHGVLWNFPDDQGLQKIAQTIYQAGGYVTAVCHGVVGLLNLKLENGDFLMAGKEVSGFTDTEE